jgi:hypothetical protein
MTARAAGTGAASQNLRDPVCDVLRVPQQFTAERL